MKNLFSYFFLPLVLSPFFAASQSGPTDSLEQIVRISTNIEERFEDLFELAAINIGKAPDRSWEYSRQCIAIAEAGGYTIGLGNCLNAKG